MATCAGERLTDDLFERALIERVAQGFRPYYTAEMRTKTFLAISGRQKDNFEILPTRFGKSSIFQMLPRVIKVLHGTLQVLVFHHERSGNEITRLGGD